MSRIFNLKEFIVFGIAGVFGYGVDVICTLLLSNIVGPYIARIPAFIGAATATWIINRNITFNKINRVHDNLLKEYTHYVTLMLLGLIVNYTVYVITISMLGDGTYTIALSVALGSLAGMFVNYFNSKKYIFGNKK